MSEAMLRVSLERLAGLVTEDHGATWGSRAAPFQWDFARAVLDPAGVRRQFWAERCRGANKTTDLAAMVLVLLDVQAPAGARCYSGAMDADQAAELVDHARLIAGRSGLGRVFEFTDRSIRHRAKDARFTALAADASGIGKDAWLLIIDELTNFENSRRARRFWTALISGSRKREGCRTIVISNAPEAESWTFKLRETARTSRRWHWQTVPAGQVPWISSEDLAALAENLVEGDYRRLILNEVTSGENALARRADIEAVCVLPGPVGPQPGHRYVITVDLAVVTDNAVAAVMHAEDAEGVRRTVCDRMRVWEPRKGMPVLLGDVEEWLREMAMAYRAEIIFDPSEGRGMEQRLEADGYRVKLFTFSTASVGRLGVALHNAIRDRRVLLPADPDLIEELVRVRLRRTGPGQWRLDHPGDGHDDRAVAIAMGMTCLLDQPLSRPHVPGRVRRWAIGRELDQMGGSSQARRLERTAPGSRDWTLDSFAPQDPDAYPETGNVRGWA